MSAVGPSPCLRQTVVLVCHMDYGCARRLFRHGVSGRVVPSLARSCLAGHPVCVVLDVVPRCLLVCLVCGCHLVLCWC